ncbi:hydrogenase iron-sulfur subunit [Desulforapulum autotrophicum]
MLDIRPAEKIVVFACNWCSYAGADFAGVSRLQYPPNGRLIRTMCSGRVDEKFIWRAFEHGAPVVLVSGCHIGDCHYIDANHWTVKRVERIHKKMVKKGIRPERLQLSWISAAEGVRFAKVWNSFAKTGRPLSSKRHGSPDPVRPCRTFYCFISCGHNFTHGF